MKKIIIGLLVALFLVSMPSAKAITKPEVTGHEKVKINLFFASWCTHCHDLIKYFSDKYVDYLDYFEFVAYQVDDGGNGSNAANSSVMSEVINELNKSIKDENKKLTGGIPLVVIGDSYHKAGFGSDGTDIIEAALKEYQNDNYNDLVAKIVNDKNLSPEKKTFTEACKAAGIKCASVGEKKKLSDGAVAGIIVGVIVLGFGGLVYYSRKK